MSIGYGIRKMIGLALDIVGYGIRKMIGLALDIERLRDQQGISPLNEARYREAQAAIDTATHELEQNFIDDIRRISSLEKGKK